MKRVIKATAIALALAVSLPALPSQVEARDNGKSSFSRHSSGHGGGHQSFSRHGGGHGGGHQSFGGHRSFSRHSGGHSGGHHGSGAAYGVLGFALGYVIASATSHDRHQTTSVSYNYQPAQACHAVEKHGADSTGRPAKIGGTMCYDQYGSGYIVSGSRHIINYY